MFTPATRRSALIALLALGLALPALTSARTSDGLGQAFPAARDASLSPGWHVYVFHRNGIKYIQVTDLSGRIIGAIGTANKQFITLPIGAYANYVSTPLEPATLPAGVAPIGTPTVVYHDNGTTVSVTPLSNNGVQMTSLAACANPIECNTNVVGSGAGP